MKGEGDIPGIKRTIHLIPLSIFTIGVAATAVSASISEHYWDLLGLLLLLTLAASLSGALPGFLFGIPRFNRTSPRREDEKPARYLPNTNLEEVSDWLTKIIIGITLTQLTKIPLYLQDIADYILINSNCGQMNCPFAKPVIISLLIFFIIAGFITAYFYTRLYLPNLFTMMEENRIREAEIAIWRESAASGPRKSGGSGNMTRIKALTDDETALLKQILRHDNLFTKKEHMTYRELAAMRVMMDKGIITASGSRLPGGASTLRITDEAILRELTGLPDPSQGGSDPDNASSKQAKE